MVFTGLLLPQALLSCGLKVGPGFKERDFDAHSPLVCPLSSFAENLFLFPFKVEMLWRRGGLEEESVHNKCPFG